jgi:cytochrome P450
VGTDVLFGVTATHFMPELFADPDKFDITRYDEPRNEHKKRGAFAPYGLGPHVCLGAGLAEVAMMLDMAALLRAVRVELIDPKQDIKVRQDVTLSLGNGFRVRLKERRHSLIDA